jgi:multidrug efflux pump
MILSNYAIKFRTAVFVFMVVLIVAGVNNYVTMPREGAPDITIPYVIVTAAYEGTAPQEMEQLVTIPIEKELNDIDGVKEVRSTSAESVSSIVVEFMAGEDIDEAQQRVKDKIDLAKPDLPDDLDEPVVQSINFSTDMPIYIFALHGETSLSRLKNLAEDLQDRIELLPGVKEAAVSGTREREIRVEFDLQNLIAYDMPIGLVMQRIAEENSTVSAGNIEVAGDKYQVRVPGEFALAAEMREILLASRDSGPVYLTDVAEIVDTYKDRESISRLNGKPSVSVSVKKRSGENSVWVIEDVEAILDEFRLPPGIEMTVVMDESDYIDDTIKELENNIVSGFLLVLIVLLIFMGGRNSFFVALAIPMSMLVAFILLPAFGFTLNMMVLYSLVLAVGMLVDNAIVIVENIYRLRTEGLSRIQAARVGAGEVAWPVITSTLTTLAAFSPLMFWPDIMGQFMGIMPKTLIIVLSASLFVAIVINPAVCSALISGRKRDLEEKPHPFMKWYEGRLRAALRCRVPILLAGFLFLLFSALTYARYGKGVELFPDVEPRRCTIQIRFPQGTTIERTDEALRSIERKLPGYEDVKFFLTTVGESGGQDMGASETGTHVGNILVEFLELHERTGDTAKLIDVIRDDIGVIAGADLNVEKQEEGPPTGPPVSIELSGDDFDTLVHYAGVIQREIETVPGLVEIQDDMEEALPEIQFLVDRERAALLGLDTGQIGTFLRAAIYGLESSRFRADEEEYDITVRLPEFQRDSVSFLERVFIPTSAGASVPLTSVGRMVYTGGRGAINRKDQKRVITIQGNDRGRGVDKIIADVQARLSELDLPRGYAISYAGDTEEMEKSGRFLVKAFGMALGGILVILVIQFNSAILPIVILFSVLLSLIGVLWGLLITGMRFGVIMTGLGVISLAGIVVNNAIVLIDAINQRRRSGMSAEEALVDAGRTRLRPVLLTAATTILGLIPMAVGYSIDIHKWPPSFITGAESSAWWAPMAVAVIFGLALATVLTLVFVPVMYSLVDSAAQAVRSRLSAEKDPGGLRPPRDD